MSDPSRALLGALLWLAASAPTFQAAAQDDIEDALSGFDDLEPYPDTIALDRDLETPEVFEQKSWELDGSVAAATSYNLVDHRSGTGTDFGGWSKLRLTARLDLEGQWVARAWRYRFSTVGWHDFSYALHDRDYSDAVLDEYEQNFELQDAWVLVPLAEDWELKLGRQVMIFGFADNLRVLDTWNPLDNLEPGLSDIEDIRRPIGMLRVDRFLEPWQITGAIAAEQRFSRNPPIGSDYYSLENSNGEAIEIREVTPNSFESLNYAVNIVARFSGWDFTASAIRHWADRPWLDASSFEPQPLADNEQAFLDAAVLRHSRVNQFGFGFQRSLGSWLFKQEATLTTDLEFTTSGTDQAPLTGIGGLPQLGAGGIIPEQQASERPMGSQTTREYSGLAGFEYYGFANSTIAVEMTQRRIESFGEELAGAGYLEWRGETAIRANRDFLNNRIRAYVIAIFLNDDIEPWSKDGGALYRLSADYDWASGLVLTGGLVIYSKGDQQPFSTFSVNDRVYAEIRYSF